MVHRAAARAHEPRDDGNAVPQLPVSVLRFFDKEDQRIEPTDIVRCINSAVGKRMTAEDMSRLYEKELLPLVRRFIGPVKYCMFVDAIDEYLHGDEGMLIDIIQQSWIEDDRTTSSDGPSQRHTAGTTTSNTQAVLHHRDAEAIQQARAVVHVGRAGGVDVSVHPDIGGYFLRRVREVQWTLVNAIDILIPAYR